MAKALEVKKDLYWVGALDPELRVFDVIMRTPYGTTYNAFLLKGSKATVLFEANKEEKWEEFEERIESVIGKDGKLDYIVLNHTEPDHSGAVGKLMERYPDATLVATTVALRNIEQICNRTFAKTIGVSAASKPTIDVGGYTLNFIIAPLLHWPDTMLTYIPELKTLVTCDFFGAHYSNPLVFNDAIAKDPEMKKDMLSAYRHYFDCIFGPFKANVLQGIDKIKDLDVDTICCSHGPVLREDLPFYIDMYKNWAAPLVRKNVVVIPYASAYRFTKHLAETMAEEITKRGYEAKLMDIVEADTDTIMAAVADAKGLLLGSPTLVGEALPPIWDICSRLNPIVHNGLVAGVFGSFGWSGEGVKNIHGRLLQLNPRIRVPLPFFSVKFKPSDEELLKAREWANSFVDAIEKK